MRKSAAHLLAVVALLLPGVTFASMRTFAELANFVTMLLNNATVLLIVMAMAIFFWGAVIGLYKNGDEKNHKKMYTFLGWGVGVLFLMLSIGGVIKLLQNTIFSGDGLGSNSGGGTTCASFGNCTFGE